MGHTVLILFFPAMLLSRFGTVFHRFLPGQVVFAGKIPLVAPVSARWAEAGLAVILDSLDQRSAL